MSRAIDTAGVELPGLPTRRLVLRLGGMLLFCLAGALVTTYANYFLLSASGDFHARSVWAPWREAWLGGFFWPGAIVGTIWAWSWSVARLWRCRWIRAGILITVGTLGIVLVGLLVQWPIAFVLEFLWIAAASVGFGEWRVLVRP